VKQRDGKIITVAGSMSREDAEPELLRVLVANAAGRATGRGCQVGCRSYNRHN